MSILQETQGRRRVDVRRKLRRLSNPSFPFFPYWLLPILCLGFLSLFATSCVHSTTRKTTNEALERINANWVRPDIDGRYVTLRGAPPDTASASAAYQAVENAVSKTWFGSGIQATRVIEAYDTPIPSAITAADPAVTSTGPVTDHSWRFERREGVLTLTGEVPDEAARQSIVESAQFAANGARVDDRLTVTNRVAARGYSTTALRGTQVLGRCSSGSATFENAALAINCEAAQADAIGLRSLAGAPLAFGTVSTINILATEEIINCESQLNTLLASARIEFATGSDVINAQSAALLTSIAEEAKACPGVLRIEGHTDNQGSAELNADLSLRRANAVRIALISRGLIADQLIAEGFGPSVPLASNDTELGRSRNRRIQFRVVRPQ